MLLTLIHFVHLASGILWGGGTLLFALAFYPLLARLDHGEAQVLWGRIAPVVGPALGISGGLAMLSGLARAWAGGGVTAFGDFLAPYGLWVLAALVLAIAEGAIGGAQRGRIEAALADPARYAAEGPGLMRRAALLSGGLISAIIVIMAILGLGLY